MRRASYNGDLTCPEDRLYLRTFEDFIVLVAVPKETAAGERRVALVPTLAGRLAERGFEVAVEAGAGLGAGYRDRDYEERGVKIEPSADSLLERADLTLKVRPPQSLPD
ncbi:MAG TPA: hypothetical protein VK116_01555, partial [Planctomycetota bacterium]|nr:hypothetical protein [Planctomycetota bacterium]